MSVKRSSVLRIALTQACWTCFSKTCVFSSSTDLPGDYNILFWVISLGPTLVV